MNYLAVECGGTFTDFILADASGHVVKYGKVLSTPSRPTDAVRTVVESLRTTRPVRMIHGSTVATNALIERRGARVALITTKGFRDVIFLRRQDRESMYDLFYQTPQPLIDREDIVEVDERMRVDGSVISPLTRDAIEHAIASLADDVEIVAVSLLHSYANPVHEKLIAKTISELRPDLPVVLSSDVAPVFREYERTSTVVADAFLRPMVSNYLRALQALGQDGLLNDIDVIQSNGGTLPLGYAVDLPLNMLRSGPAAGVAGSELVARRAGIRNAISLDMGGTSTDVSVLIDGIVQFAPSLDAGGLPITVPMVDINAVGAGGGSVVAVDSGGLITIGPESAGSEPGPILYGRGGQRLTLTDVAFFLGRLDVSYLEQSGLHCDPRASIEAVRNFADDVGRDAEAFAHEVYALACEKMANAVRVITTERGIELDGYTIIAFGGSGPLYASQVAETLGLKRVLVPPRAGVMSAFGLLAAPFRREFSETRFVQDVANNGASFNRLMADFRDRCQAALQRERRDLGGLRMTAFADFRYAGQGYELRVAVENPFETSGETLASAFTTAHEARYGYADASRHIDVVTLRLVFDGDPLVGVRSGTAKEDDRATAVSGADHPSLPHDSDGPGIARNSLVPGDSLSGPALVSEETSTVWISAGWRCVVDANLNLDITRSNE